ncbi:MAG TPA: glycosyltransferase [Pseudomonadales bacterium]
MIFVACNRNRHRYLEDPSFLYRCGNLAGALDKLGHEAELAHVTRFNPLKAADLVVFHRPRFTVPFRAVMAVLQRRRVPVAADVDDLVFDPSLAGCSPGVLNGLVPIGDISSLFLSHRRALEQFSEITVSTRALEQEVLRCLPRARTHWLPNAVHHSWLDLPEPSAEPVEQRPVITYLPGTRSHDRDFALVAPVLQALLADYPELRLQITGPLTFDLRARPGQVQHFERLPFDQLHPQVQRGWLNLAPLEATPFTRCKSAIKVIEAGYWGVPTLCSPLPDAQRFVGAGAVVAATAQNWHDHIERLLIDGGYRRKLTHGLREKVLARADVFAVAQSLLQLCRRESAFA